MSDHIVSSFDAAMRALSAGLVEMGEHSAEQLRRAISALDRRDLDLAARVKADDARTDALYEATEQRVIDILALRNPVAVDLREVVSAMQMARDFERIGDYAKNIAKRAPGIFAQPKSDLDREIVEMGMVTFAHVKDVIRAYERRDADLSLAVWKSDDEIDDFCNKIFGDVLGAMAERKGEVAASMQMLFVAKNLERIGDHATNVAESVRFILTGEKMRGPRPKRDKTSTDPAKHALN